ncbi:MAG: hypothetical protein AAFP77_08860 [Bacteroidota bacterium]
MKLAILPLTILLFSAQLAFAQWQPLTSPSGAQFRDLVQSESRIFAATYSGLFYSDNNGTSWTSAFGGGYERGFVSTLRAVGSVVICRIRSRETNEYSVFISENSGDDWRELSEPGASSSIFRNLHYNGESIVYQVAGTVVFVSSDLGETWGVENTSTLPFFPNQLQVAGGLFFMTDNDYVVWQSDSSFQNWVQLPFDLEVGQLPKIYVDGDLMLVGVPEDRIFYSTDGGASWDNSASIPDFRSDNEGFWSDGDRLYTLYQRDIYASEDQGMTWAKISPLNSSYTDLLFPAGADALLVEQEAIYQSPDYGFNVTPAMAGIQGANIYNFKLVEDQLLFYNDRGLRLADVGEDEITATDVAIADLSLDEMVSGGGYYFVNEYTVSSNPYKHEIYRVAPDGTSTFIRGSTEGAWLVSDHLRYTDGKLFYFPAGGGYVYSDNNGNTWNPVQELTDNGENIYDFVRHGNTVFSAGVETVKRLREGEVNWELVTDGLNLESFPIGIGVRSMRFYSTPSALFLTFARGSDDFLEFFVSHDNGDTWQETATDLPDIIAPYSNAPQGVKNIVEIDGFHIMALRDVGIVVSADQGLNWTVYNDGLPTDVIHQLDLYDGRVIVGTGRHGFWELGASDIQLRSITGNVFFDENANGTLNAGEPLLPNVKLILADESDLAFTNEEGQYQLLFVNDGDYGPDLDNPYLESVPAQRNTADAGSLDFALQLEEDLIDFCVSLHTDRVHRPGFPMRYYLKYQNFARAVATANLQLNYYDFLQFEGASLTPSSQSDNQLYFELGSLPPLASGTIVVDFTLDVSAPLGDEVLSSLTAEISEPDANDDNNFAELEDIVVGAYDPNDIQVDLDRINPTQVANEIELEYRIRFQNTGNYPADRVVVRNKIADGLNMSSIRAIETSHPVAVERSASQELSFVFDNIQLPDSTSNEAESHGFITYRIKVDPSLMLGDTIPNQAAIFFDFNPPIITNIATTAVDDFTRTRNIAAPDTRLTSWPNPVPSGGAFQLSGSEAGPGMLMIFDALGQLIRQIEQFDPAGDQVQATGLAKGQYYLVLETQKRWWQGSVIVQ